MQIPTGKFIDNELYLTKTLFLEVSWFLWDALRDLVQFVQFKKREKTHRGVLLLLKVTILYGINNSIIEFCQ